MVGIPVDVYTMVGIDTNSGYRLSNNQRSDNRRSAEPTCRKGARGGKKLLQGLLRALKENVKDKNSQVYIGAKIGNENKI